MTAFFVSGIEDADAAEQIWQATKSFAEETHGWEGRISDRRIFRLGYLHDGKHMEAEVGVPHPYGRESIGRRSRRSATIRRRL